MENSTDIELATTSAHVWTLHKMDPVSNWIRMLILNPDIETITKCANTCNIGGNC